MTAEMGMMRQLSVTEILMQVWWAQRIVRERNYPNLRNVVFMGMGEPLDNWPAVRPAIRSLTDQRMHGFGARHVTLSTVGPSAEKIKKPKGYRVSSPGPFMRPEMLNDVDESPPSDKTSSESSKHLKLSWPRVRIHSFSSTR